MSRTFKLGEITSFYSGGTPSKKQPEYFMGEIPWITGADIKEHGEIEPRSFITQEAVDNSAANIIPKGTVLLVTRTSVGKTTVTKEDISFSQDITGIKSDPEVLLPRYLNHFLRSRTSYFENHARGATIKGVNRPVVASLEIPIPSVQEQGRISDLLESITRLQRKRRRSIELLDELAQSIFLDMFGDPIANPRSWERKKFREVVASIDSGKSPKCHSTPAREGKWGVLKLGAVTSCEYSPGENKELPKTEHPKPEHEVQPGDLLFTRKNTPELVGACALVDNTPPRLLLPDLIFRINLKDESVVTKNYLHRLLIHPTKRRKVQELAGGSAASMVNISKSRLLGSEIELPPIELQEEFDARIRSIQELKKHHQAHLAHLDELFASVQQRAFDGTLWDDPVMTS